MLLSTGKVAEEQDGSTGAGVAAACGSFSTPGTFCSQSQAACLVPEALGGSSALGRHLGLDQAVVS